MSNGVQIGNYGISSSPNDLQARYDEQFGPGECVKGWVYFEVPKEKSPEFVVFSSEGSRFEWSL
jgi:hypothetical protein